MNDKPNQGGGLDVGRSRESRPGRAAAACFAVLDGGPQADLVKQPEKQRAALELCDMNGDVLYLLKPGFMESVRGPYFCLGCVQMVRLLGFYPALKPKLQVRHLDFPRPRSELVALRGEENQSCPALVLRAAPEHLLVTPPVRPSKGRWFVEGANEIARYLARAHGTDIPH